MIKIFDFIDKQLKRIADFRTKYADNLKGVSPIAEEDSLRKTNVVNVLVSRDQLRRRILIMNIGSTYSQDIMRILSAGIPGDIVRSS